MRVQYEYLLFTVLGEYMGTARTRKEATAFVARAPEVYTYRKQQACCKTCATSGNENNRLIGTEATTSLGKSEIIWQCATCTSLQGV